MARIQTLGMKYHTATEQIDLRECLVVFDKLARWHNQDEDSQEIVDPKTVDKWINKIIEVDLGLNYDENIIIDYDFKHNFKLDLSQTFYSEDEKANIYYIFYGINMFRPYYNLKVHVAGDRFANSYNFKGIGSYWLPTSDSFLGNVLQNVEMEDEQSFSNSFHILGMFYLALNGYKNYADAENKGFKINAAS